MKQSTCHCPDNDGRNLLISLFALGKPVKTLSWTSLLPSTVLIQYRRTRPNSRSHIGPWGYCKRRNRRRNVSGCSWAISRRETYPAPCLLQLKGELPQHLGGGGGGGGGAFTCLLLPSRWEQGGGKKQHISAQHFTFFFFFLYNVFFFFSCDLWAF